MNSNVNRALLMLIASTGLALFALGSAFAAGGPGAQCTGEYVEEWEPDENHPDGGEWTPKYYKCLGTCSPGTCVKRRFVGTTNEWSCSCNVGSVYYDWTMVVGVFHEGPGNPPAPGSTYCDVHAVIDSQSTFSCMGECEEPLECRQMPAWVNIEGNPPVRTRGTQCTCQP